MLSIKTPAKVNLFLNIRRLREDGYHEVATVMQAVDLFDVLHIRPVLEKPELYFSSSDPELGQNPKDNLVVKAWRLFFKTVPVPPLGLEVHLDKHIPKQAGMGGGSSDAAAMLLALNHLTHAGLSVEQLRQLGARLGSDVPFFITGGVALATGRGEIIKPLRVDPPYQLPMVIVVPKHLAIPTAEAYAAFRAQNRYRPVDPEHLMMMLRQVQTRREQGLDPGLTGYVMNDFESVLFEKYLLLWEMSEMMKACGVERPILCGSGSAMAGFCEHAFHRKKAITDQFPENDYDVFWVHTFAGGPGQ